MVLLIDFLPNGSHVSFVDDCEVVCTAWGGNGHVPLEAVLGLVYEEDGLVEWVLGAAKAKFMGLKVAPELAKHDYALHGPAGIGHGNQHLRGGLGEIIPGDVFVIKNLLGLASGSSRDPEGGAIVLQPITMASSSAEECEHAASSSPSLV